MGLNMRASEDWSRENNKRKESDSKGLSRREKLAVEGGNHAVKAVFLLGGKNIRAIGPSADKRESPGTCSQEGERGGREGQKPYLLRQPTGKIPSEKEGEELNREKRGDQGQKKIK